MERDAAVAGLIPLATGLAVAEALAGLGARTTLKWPNDVQVAGRKVAGVLCELRRLPAGDAIVVGIGVNVRQRGADFPPELRAVATSLAEAGVETDLERVAAAVCDAFEHRLLQLRAGDRAGVLAAWSALAPFWGEPVSVRGPRGDVSGVAQRLDDTGALVLRLDGGAEWTAVAGDLVAGAR
jgi:BirA family biotin operon repressor/biotin-[acetyl-CoA-carboxylase] ligase